MSGLVTSRTLGAWTLRFRLLSLAYNTISTTTTSTITTTVTNTTI